MRLSICLLVFFCGCLLPLNSFAQKSKSTTYQPFSYWFKGSTDNQNFELMLNTSGSAKIAKTVRGTCYFDKEKISFPLEGTYKPSTKEWILQYTRPDNSKGTFILQKYNGKTATGKHAYDKKSDNATFEVFPSLSSEFFMAQVQTLFAEEVKTKAPHTLVCIKEQSPKSKDSTEYDQLSVTQYAQNTSLQFLHESNNTIDEMYKIFGLQIIPSQPQPTVLVYTYTNSSSGGESHYGSYTIHAKVLGYQNNTWNTLQDTTLLNERWDTQYIHYDGFQTNSRQIHIQPRDKPLQIWEWNGKGFKTLPLK